MEKNTKPLVSIIIPLYNCSEYIEECLNSVLNQKFKDIEVIVVDDGSTDNSASIVDNYKNVRLIKQANQGVTAARKAGVEASNGEWIMFVDADDAVREEIISAWLPLMHEDVDIIIGKMPHERVVNADQLAYDILNIRRFPKAPWLKMFRRELFSKSKALDIPREIVWGEDMLMLLRLSEVATGNVVYSKERNYEYRRHSSQITKTYRVTSDYELIYYNLLLQSIPTIKMDFHFITVLIKFRLYIFERILKDTRYTHDDVRKSIWFEELLGDIKKIEYKPSLWYNTLLRFGNGNNYHRLHSIKWIFKCFNAY